MPRLMEALQDNTDMDKRRNYKWPRGAVVRGRLPREQLGLGLTSLLRELREEEVPSSYEGGRKARLSSTAPG